MGPHPEQFEVDVGEATLTDLSARLRHARLAPDFSNQDWRYGVEGGYLAELLAHWRDSYDWRATEREINSFANFRVELDGVPIHFIHERGQGPSPTPLLMTHGWPWTFWDYHKVIRPLVDPVAFGGQPEDAFDVVIPSLPGYGFSTPLTTPGIQFTKTTDLWVRLMREVLGYDRFAAYGGDWGSLVSAHMGHRYTEHLIGLQLGLCFPLDFDLPSEDAYPPEERHRFEQTKAKMATCVSHMAVQSSDPQTLAYALQDSPVGLLAWILERRRNWSGCEAEVERCFSKDDLITTAMIYWVTESIGTSMRYYWETQHDPWQPAHDRRPVVEAKTGILLWPQEVALMPTEHMERYYNVERLTEMPAGGHFHPMEQPDALVGEVRAFHRQLRDGAEARLAGAQT